MIRAQYVSVSSRSVNIVLWAMKYDWSGRMRPSDSSPSISPDPRNRDRLDADAAALDTPRMASTETVGMRILLSAYLPRLPISHAVAHRVRSMGVGSAKGGLKIAVFVLKVDR